MRLVLLLLILASLFLIGCERSYRAMARERAEYAVNATQGPIFLAVIEDHDPNRRDYVQGARLAVQKINENGGVLGRPLAIQLFQGAETYDESLPVIRSITSNPRISTVMGHRTSSVSVPASAVYEAAEVLFLSPFATDPRLTLHGFQFVLRTLPDNRAMAAQSANVAALFGYENVAVLYGRDDYSRELAFLFEDAARREGLRVVFRGSFFAEQSNYRTLIGRMNLVDFDAIYLAAEAEAGARALRQLREMDMNQPVIGSDSLGSTDVARAAGAAGDRTLIPSVYAQDDPTPSNRAFVAAYRAEFDNRPNKDAAQGYDSVRLFAEIAKQAGSTEPRVLAAKAHFIDPVAGVAGVYAYDQRGDIYGKNYRFEVLRAGRWRSLAGVEAPYLLAAYRDRLAQELDEAQSPPDPGASPAVPPPAMQLDQSQTHAIEDAQEIENESEAGQGADPDGDDSPVPEAEREDMQMALLDSDALNDPRAGRLTRYRAWLALAQAVLEFERLGLVIAENDEGEALAGMAQAVGDELGFVVEICRIPDTPLTEQADEQSANAASGKVMKEALRCYSRLAVRIDAMLVTTETDLDPTYLRRLNVGLRAYSIPTFALLEELDEDYGLAMALISASTALDHGAQAQDLDGVLKDMRFYDLSRRLASMPAVRVDLSAFKDIGRPLSLQELSVISGTFSFDMTDVDTAASNP